MKQYNTEPVKQALATAKTTLVLLPQSPSLDTVAAGLSLYLSLTKLQKTASIGCSTPMTVGLNRLFGVDKIKSRIGNQNLVISFSYPEDSLEKVSYDKDPQNQKFHLTIEPKAGKPPLDPSNIEYSYTGSSADIIFVVGARSLEDLGELYSQEKSLLDNQAKMIVNLSNLDKNAQFGKVNLYDPEVSGCSEIAFSVLTDLGISLEPDIATNLLAGIEAATNNLASVSTADTFEIIAQLLRAGAKKGHLIQRPAFNQMPPSPISTPNPLPQPSLPVSSQPQVQRPFPAQPQPAVSPILNQPATSSPAVSQSHPQPDWLKPKVYKSSTPLT